MKASVLSLFFALIMTLFGCASGGTTAPSATPAPTSAPTAQAAVPTGEKVNIEIEMQDGGIIKAELYPDVAPITVANFVKLCNENFYDGLIFHRVIPGFMIQGGGFDTSNVQKEAASIKGEFAQNGVQNNLKHTRGVLSMARTRIPDSASSQFFIMHEDAPHLDGMYAAFGKVTEGMDIVDKIANVPTTTVNGMMEDYPTEPQVIKTIRVVTE